MVLTAAQVHAAENPSSVVGLIENPGMNHWSAVQTKSVVDRGKVGDTIAQKRVRRKGLTGREAHALNQILSRISVGKHLGRLNQASHGTSHDGRREARS